MPRTVGSEVSSCSAEAALTLNIRVHAAKKSFGADVSNNRSYGLLVTLLIKSLELSKASRDVINPESATFTLRSDPAAAML